MTVRTRQPLRAIVDVLELYLGEAAFCYERRLAELASADGAWENAAAHEQRLELQLEGLCVGGRVAFDLFSERMLQAEAYGEAFSVGLLCLLLPTVAPKEALAEAIAAASPHRAELIDALRFAPTGRGDEWLQFYLASPSPLVRSAALEACAGRPALIERVAQLMLDPDPSVALRAQRTHCALGARNTSVLDAELRDTDPDRAALALELLLLTDPPAAARACKALAAEAHPRLLSRSLGLCAVADGRGSVEHILRVLAQRPEIAAQAWVALGLAGDADAFDAFLARLDAHWELPEQHEELMSLCQGALLLGGTLVVPEFNAFDFQPEELDSFRDEARRVWGALRGAAQPNLPQRRSEPFSKAALTRDLLAPGHPCRELCKLQLDVWFDCRVPFDFRAPFTHQRCAALALAAWAARV